MEKNGRIGKPEQDLILAGYMALAGSVSLIPEEQEKLLERLPEELLQDACNAWEQMKMARTGLAKAGWPQPVEADPLGQIEEDLLPQDMVSAGISAWYPVGQGGISNALWHMAQAWDTGFVVQMKEIPVRQETIEICEVLGINPYYLYSEHCMLIAADHGDRLCAALQKRGMAAAVIGVLHHNKDKVLQHDDTVSHLNRPREDELARYHRV